MAYEIKMCSRRRSSSMRSSRRPRPFISQDEGSILSKFIPLAVKLESPLQGACLGDDLWGGGLRAVQTT